MSIASKMHVDEVNLDIALVKRLLAGQCPQWVDFQVKPVEFDGWDNRTFRLGAHMLVRLPSAAEYAHR